MKTTAKNTSTEDSESYASKMSGSILRTLGMEDEPERDPTGEDVLNKAKDTAETAQKAIVAGGKEVMRKSQDAANFVKESGDSAVEKTKTTARETADAISVASKRAGDKTRTAAHDALETVGHAMKSTGDSMQKTAERIAPEVATPEPKGILRSVSDHFKHDVVEPITNLAHSVQDKFSHTSEENAAHVEPRNKDPAADDTLKKRALDVIGNAEDAFVAGGKEGMRKSRKTADLLKESGESAVEKAKTTAGDAVDNAANAAQIAAGNAKATARNATETVKTGTKRAGDKTWTAAKDAVDTVGDAMNSTGDSMQKTAERIAPEVATPEPKGILRSVSDHFKHDVVEPITNLAHNVQDKFSHTSEENAAPAEIRNKDPTADDPVADSTLKKRALDDTVGSPAPKRLNAA